MVLRESCLALRVIGTILQSAFLGSYPSDYGLEVTMLVGGHFANGATGRNKTDAVTSTGVSVSISGGSVHD